MIALARALSALWTGKAPKMFPLKLFAAVVRDFCDIYQYSVQGILPLRTSACRLFGRGDGGKRLGDIYNIGVNGRDVAQDGSNVSLANSKGRGRGSEEDNVLDGNHFECRLEIVLSKK